MVGISIQTQSSIRTRTADHMTAVLPDARVNKNLQGPSARARVQKFGGYLAGMIMPNIGAFIAWGLITALFIEKGWLPQAFPATAGFSAVIAALVAPMIYFLLPLLIGRSAVSSSRPVSVTIVSMSARLPNLQNCTAPTLLWSVSSTTRRDAVIMAAFVAASSGFGVCLLYTSPSPRD